ncbi:MAG: IS200/IS605 family accessory protein TnpB-related protein [Candidatus Hodarchaeales archaeon]
MIRSCNIAKRTAYQRLREEIPPSKPELKQIIRDLILKQPLNVRYIVDAISEAKTRLKMQKEHLRFLISSLQNQMSKLNRKIEKTPNHKQKQWLLQKWEKVHRKFQKLQHQFNTDTFPAVVFGGRENFKRLTQGKLSKEEWRFSRQKQLYSIGEESRGGNQNIKILQGHKVMKVDREKIPDFRLDDFYLRIVIPVKNKPRGLKIYGKLYRKDVIFMDWSWLDGRPYTMRLIRKKDYRISSPVKAIRKELFSLHISFYRDLPPPKYSFENGVIGADINPDKTALAYITCDGNLIKLRDVPHHEITYISAPKRAQEVNRIAKEISEDALKSQKGLVIENLSFRQQNSSRSFNRMIHNFAFKQLTEAIIRHAARAGVPIRKVDPSYTSVIGKIKYTTKYPLSNHQAAAFVIGRRGLGIKEKIPQSFRRLFHVMLEQMDPMERKKYVLPQRYTNKDFWKLLANNAGLIQKIKVALTEQLHLNSISNGSTVQHSSSVKI